jgi:hypothetical protein
VQPESAESGIVVAVVKGVAELHRRCCAGTTIPRDDRSGAAQPPIAVRTSASSWAETCSRDRALRSARHMATVPSTAATMSVASSAA